MDIFSDKAKSTNDGLEQSESDHFRKHGWIGPFPLLPPDGVKAVVEAHNSSIHRFMPGHMLSQARHADAFTQHPWFKSLHAYLPHFYDIACHPSLVSRVASIIGPDVVVWGVSVTIRRPRDIHRWHVDVEHRRWRGISAFIGLSGTSSLSTLKVIGGSHRIVQTPQEIGVSNDSEAIAEALKREPKCELVTPELREGEFFLFDGTLWHGSANIGEDTRYAVIAQYSPTSERIKIPLTWNEPIDWHQSSPPCVLVRGTDHYGINRLVSRPA